MLPTVSASFLLSLYVFCVRGKVPLKQGVTTVILTTHDTLAKAVERSKLLNLQQSCLLSPLSPLIHDKSNVSMQ